MSTPVIPRIDSATLRLHLRTSTRECTDRGLNYAAKWSAELLNSLPPPSSPQPHASTSQLPLETATTHSRFRTSTPVKDSIASTTNKIKNNNNRQSLPNLTHLGTINRHQRDSIGSVTGFSPHLSVNVNVEGMMEEEEDDEMWNVQRRKDEQDELESDVYDLALSYLRTYEHLRAAHTLRDCSGPKARWLRCYTKFLAGEKRAQEEDGILLGPTDKGTLNPFAQELLSEMASWEVGSIEQDGWLLYLKALILLCLPPLAPSPFPKRDSSAMGELLDPRLSALDCLVASVKLVPYNWSAWLKLASCLEGAEELEATMKFVPTVFPSLFFFVHATIEIHSAGPNLHEVLDDLDISFPHSSNIKGMRALVHYHVREFEEATALFSELQLSDPYRVEDIDIFSNILYVTEKRAQLAALAQEYTKMDRARPEVCCLVGNYYSLRRDHEKAILYFRRALKLDKSYLSAWTLMGHEYVEIKNTNAAIASYRRAVDVNRKDYRAWYGLGQTYELLAEPFYALNYYQKATALRPYDARMWSALAACYEKLKRVPDAIKSYQRALVSSEPGDTETAIRIARLYSSLGQSFAAAAYYRRALAEGLRAGGTPKVELGDWWIWLAKYEMKEFEEAAEIMGQDEDHDHDQRNARGGDLLAAQDYLREAVTIQEHKEVAKALLAKLEVMLLL